MGKGKKIVWHDKDLDGSLLDLYNYVISQGGDPAEAYIVDGDDDGPGFISYASPETDKEYEKRLNGEAQERANRAAEKKKLENNERKEYERLKKKFGDS